MTMCEACKNIITHKHGELGHGDLVKFGSTGMNFGHGVIIKAQYTCKKCGTDWEYENNKSERHAGWRLL